MLFSLFLLSSLADIRCFAPSSAFPFRRLTRLVTQNCNTSLSRLPHTELFDVSNPQIPHCSVFEKMCISNVWGSNFKGGHVLIVWPTNRIASKVQVEVLKMWCQTIVMWNLVENAVVFSRQETKEDKEDCLLSLFRILLQP